MAVPAGVEVRLDAGGRLTATTRCEWLVGVFAAEPFERAQMLDALRVRAGDGDEGDTVGWG